MPCSDHFQNLASSTIKGPASLNKESLLCGLASSQTHECPGRIDSAASYGDAVILPVRTAPAAHGGSPARHGNTHAECDLPGQHGRQKCRPFVANTSKICQIQLYRQDRDIRAPAAT